MHLKGVLVEDRHKDTILSAGDVVVNVNDWFFLRKNIELKYIALYDAVIKLQRTDSVWRHEFLLDYFSSPASTQPKKQKPLNLALKNIDLKNILIKQHDGWLGQDITVSLASMRTDTRVVDFKQKLINLETLTINKPYFAIRDYNGNRPPREKKQPVAKQDSTVKGPQWNSGNWRLFVKQLTLRDGTLKIDNDQNAAAHKPGIATQNEFFDDRHIAFEKLNAEFRSLKWQVDTFSADLHLDARERSGFLVKSLNAGVKVTPKEMSFGNLDLKTNNSTVGDYFSMKFADFSSLSDFIDKVTLEGDFKGSEINSDDIAYFAPPLKTWKKTINLTGKISGPVSSLIGQKLKIQVGHQTYFDGDASLTGLPETNSTFMDITAREFKTTWNDVTGFAPQVKKITSPNLKGIQYLNFTGNFTGFFKDFVTFGTIRTALGTVKADLNMKFPQGKKPVYSGNVSSPNFDLGTFLNDENFGKLSLNARLKGSGFDADKGNIALESTIQFLDYNNYRYQNIRVDGELNKKIFNGILNINDSNANFTLNGLVNYAEKVPRFDFLADIRHVHFKPLHLVKDDLRLTGKLNVNFTGTNIDDVLGHANIREATLVKNGSPMSFDSLNFTSAFRDGKKYLHVSSNEFDAELTGTFNIKELPNSVKSFLTRYYPAYIKGPIHTPKNQVFSFDLKTNMVDDYIQLVDSSLRGFNNSHITGSINTLTNGLLLTALVPDFSYNNLRFLNASVHAEGNYDSLTVAGQTANIIAGDSLNIPMAAFNVVARNDVSKVMIHTGDNFAFNRARLNATVRTFGNGVRIEVEPSSFVVSGKTWSIDDKGVLEFRTGVPAQGLLAMRESNQEIVIRTLPSSAGNWNDVAIGIKNLNLGDIAPFILPSNRLEGLAEGNILIENPGKTMKITSGDFMGRGIRFDNDSLGDINATVSFDMATKELQVRGKTLNPQQKDLAYDIHLYLKDRESGKKNIIALNANRFDLKYLDRFLGFLFSDIRGEITGNFDIKGPLDALSVVGKGRLHQAGLKVNFTQCFYEIEDQDIALGENEINLNGIVLKDTVTKNPIYLRGNIMHNAFKDMFFDLSVSTRKPGTRDENNNRPVQVLKTTYNDNKLFYGDVKATGSFALVGPANNTYMKIDAMASSTQESNFTIASANSRAGKMPEWMVERKYGTAMADSIYRATESNIIYDMDITANPHVQMRFIMDDLTGDEIKGRGSGSLNIRSGTSEPLTIRGRYDIDQGNYNFTFQSFFKKPFEIKRGSENYISWSGDPLNANINIEAYYKADRVSFAPLANSGIAMDQSYSGTRENLYVDASLTGKLFEPRFKFGIRLDPNSKFRNDFNVTNTLEQISKNPSEITRQVTYLIVFNSFAPPESGVANTGLNNAVSEFGYSTISSLSGLFFNEINRKLNNELSKLFGSRVNLVFSGAVYNRNLLSSRNSAFNPNQANFSGALTFPIFNDRFIISLGSTMEVPLQSSLQQTVQFLPDVTLEWMINMSGTIRANLFYRENLDLLTTSSTGAAKLKRTGAGISYNREFDRLGEIFVNAKRRAERNARAAADSTSKREQGTKANASQQTGNPIRRSEDSLGN